jgi:hypothetical protein
MNRDLQKLLQEKWFLVAADFIAVLGVLLVGFDPKDGLQAFLAVLGILGASLIVVIPVLKDGGGKAERQAEQARLRAALADEIDRLRDDIRATAEAGNRRIGEVELDARRQAEQAAAAATAVAQRASAEINALKSEVAALKATAAELEKKVAVAQRSASVGGEAKEALEELAAKVDGLAETVRTTLATSEETAEAVAELKSAAPAVTADDLKAMRDEARKSGQKAAQALEQLSAQVDELAAAVQEVRSRPVAVVAAAPVVEAKPAAVEVDEAEPSADEAEEIAIEQADEEEATEAAEAAAPEAPAAAAESPAETVAVDGATGTALIINLMIGIGNKPFVRGTGPGLSGEKGVPMTFLGIGRWQWVCPQAEAPATVEVWKNDQSPVGEPIHLSGGESVEVDEGHFTGS